ncbi:hypothetical protein BDY19DRAFT_940134 [Irpex rosettiformis]|uniref:Uncharacterized protein n=1 Tax=Irpex rosettiformis TaxID=378272 RepID=A0ACB8U888_9APHY|nr:hypothetical protein BDY19DRAFT_940134 [Irpex rosettiformis]
MVADLLLLTATYVKTCSIRGYLTRSKMKLPITMLLFRGGTVCFSVNFFLGVVDLVFIISGNLALSGATTPLIIVLRSFVVANFLVNLREVYFGSDNDTTQLSCLRFACSCVGNIGAPLTLPGAFDDTMVSLPHKSLDPLTSGLIQAGQPESHVLVMMCGEDDSCFEGSREEERKMGASRVP